MCKTKEGEQQFTLQTAEIISFRSFSSVISKSLSCGFLSSTYLISDLSDSFGALWKHRGLCGCPSVRGQGTACSSAGTERFVLPPAHLTHWWGLATEGSASPKCRKIIIHPCKRMQGWRSFDHLSLLRCNAISVLFWWNGGLLQEHQTNILGNTMQSVVALLNNLVTCKDLNMKLLYEQGKCFLDFIFDCVEFCLFVSFLILPSRESRSTI